MSRGQYVDICATSSYNDCPYQCPQFTYYKLAKLCRVNRLLELCPHLLNMEVNNTRKVLKFPTDGSQYNLSSCTRRRSSLSPCPWLEETQSPLLFWQEKNDKFFTTKKCRKLFASRMVWVVVVVVNSWCTQFVKALSASVWRLLTFNHSITQKLWTQLEKEKVKCSHV